MRKKKTHSELYGGRGTHSMLFRAKCCATTKQTWGCALSWWRCHVVQTHLICKRSCRMVNVLPWDIYNMYFRLSYVIRRSSRTMCWSCGGWSSLDRIALLFKYSLNSVNHRSAVDCDRTSSPCALMCAVTFCTLPCRISAISVSFETSYRSVFIQQHI